jgi:glycosyltransferase involved in cell wall biosynthesis
VKVGLIHEWLTNYAGSESVLCALASLYPEAPIHTLVCDRKSIERTALANRDIRTSFLDRLPWPLRSRFRALLPLLPIAVEQFDLDGFDVVISSSHAVAKGALTRADQMHVAYVHTPARYAWDLYHRYLADAGLDRGLRSMLARWMLHRFRIWDAASANRVDHFIANSQYVASRIRKTYRRDAAVIYPPVDIGRFNPGRQREEFYLTVSRLVPYKRIDVIVEAFTKLGRPLVVIGNGPERDRIKHAAGANITFLGHGNDALVADHMERCRAFVFAADEDFGIAPVEAQAAGAPVIAYGKGGVLETVREGESGTFFQEQTAASLHDAVLGFESQGSQFNAGCIRSGVERFSQKAFASDMSKFVENAWRQFHHKPAQRS